MIEVLQQKHKNKKQRDVVCGKTHHQEVPERMIHLCEAQSPNPFEKVETEKQSNNKSKRTVYAVSACTNLSSDDSVSTVNDQKSPKIVFCMNPIRLSTVRVHSSVCSRPETKANPFSSIASSTRRTPSSLCITSLIGISREVSDSADATGVESRNLFNCVVAPDPANIR